MLLMVFQLLKLIVRIHKSLICFNVKLNMHLYMHSFLDVHYVSNYIVKKLHGCRTKPASNIKL